VEHIGTGQHFADRSTYISTERVSDTVPELKAARDFLRDLLSAFSLQRDRRGRPEMPHAEKAIGDINLEASEARILLRACGIPLSPGRRARV
jgi:hypothetical protein